MSVTQKFNLARVLAGALLTIAVLLSPGGAAGQEPTASPPSTAQKAQLYVYREGGMVGVAGHPVIFVNDLLLAQMHKSNYASEQLPPGPIIITTTFAFMGDLVMPVPIGSWSTMPGCAGMDWRRAASAPADQISLCADGLRKLFSECAPKVTYSGCALPGCVLVKTTHIPACRPSLDGSNDAPFLLHLGPQLESALANGLPERPSGNLHSQLRVEMEAGKTYFVKWSASTGGGKMTLVDSATGEKEIGKLHPVK